MEIVLCIIALVGIISVYDYFSARKWQQVTSDERNEVVFENRNKAYGAFVMRRDYNVRVIIIIGAMTFSIGAAYAIHKIIKQNEVVEVPPPIDLSTFTMDAPPLDEDIPPPPPEEEIPPMEKTIQFLPPVVTDEEVDTPPVIQEEMEDTKASTSTNDTESENFEVAEKPKEVVVEKKKEEILTFVDEPAEFPGGVAAMKKFLSENINYPQTAIELGLSGKCYLVFVVNTEGSISNVTVQRGVPDCPECDKEAVRVVRSMPKWRPGKNGGHAVSSYFNMPVNFQLK